MLENEDDFLQQLLSGMTAPNASQPSTFHSSAIPPPATQPTQPTQPTQLNETDTLLDGADDWDWDADIDEVEMKEAAPVQSLLDKVSPPLEPRRVLSPYTRCVVDAVEDSMTSKREKVLAVHSDNKSRQQYRVVLQGDWINTDVKAGDIVNIIGKFDPAGTIFITTQHNFLILHPDLLITATSIANSSACARRPLISSLLSSTTDVTPALVWGNMLHEITQACLTSNRWDTGYIDAKTDEIIRGGMDPLVKLNLNLDVAKAEIRKRAHGLQSFSQRFIGDEPKPDALLSDTRAKSGDEALLAICGLHDTEEDIWSPRWGLKGKLDASVQVLLEEKKSKVKGAQKTEKTSMPFEIKTGMAKGGMEHRAQTMLYTLLMEERYGTPVSSGLLYYTQSDEVIRVVAARNELRALIQNRNGMTAHMMRRPTGKKTNATTASSFLPPTEDDERMCKRCFAVDGCMLYKRAIEGEDPSSHTSEIAELFKDKTGHLTQSQCEFFKQWEALISLEEQEMLRFRKELWTMGASEREKTGKCFAGMVLSPSSTPASVAISAGSSAKIHRFTYTFSRKAVSSAKKILLSPTKPGKVRSDVESSLLSGHIARGDPVTISIEPEFLALSRGFVLELEPERVTVGVDTELDTQRLFSRYRVPGGDHGVVFRIDKDEMTAGIGRIRNNLAKLFYKGGDTRRLELVVDLKCPEFRDDVPPSMAPTSIGKREKPTSVLNESQQAAMHKVLSAQDYAILLGMPGTGKTTTVAEIIKELVRRGKSVLLSSYTHSAVDTILMKLLDVDFEILRLGNADKIHPSVFKMTQGARPVPTSVEEMERQFLSPPVVATTCLSIDHTLFSRRTFDVCIVDEASQITLPTCLGPLRFADIFVLVGDHFQLPPLVKSARARKGGLDVSLFRRLSEAHPHAVAELAQQYRMNEDIMKVSNTLIYDDRLKCGNAEVAARTLHVKNMPGSLEKAHATTAMDCNGSACWLKDALDPGRRVVFIDTDQVPAKESRVGDLVQNEVEASLVQQLVKAMVQGGVDESEVGVISLYRQQIKLMSHLLEGHPGIEILTADRSQGRDKDCIIISMVRSNDSDSIGDLLKDWRRLNVSFTRARSKLVIIGSRGTLDNTKILQDFFELMERNSWIYKLPKGANTAHDIRLPQPVTVSRKALKRSAAEMEKENDAVIPRLQSPRKRARTEKSAGAHANANALLKGRAILKDLVMDIQPI